MRGKSKRMEISSILEDLAGDTKGWTDEYLSVRSENSAASVLNVIDQESETMTAEEASQKIEQILHPQKVYAIEDENSEDISYIVPGEILFDLISELIYGDYVGCRSIVQEMQSYITKKNNLS